MRSAVFVLGLRRVPREVQRRPHQAESGPVEDLGERIRITRATELREAGVEIGNGTGHGDGLSEAGGVLHEITERIAGRPGSLAPMWHQDEINIRTRRHGEMHDLTSEPRFTLETKARQIVMQKVCAA